MIELEMRRLKHDRTEIYTRAIQPILWLAVYGSVMSHVRDIPTNGIPYIDYITPGVLLQSTIFVSVFYGLTLVWERETGILKRLLVAPASRYATVIGRALASGVRAVVQALIIFPVAMLLGVKFISDPVYIIAAFLMLFMISGGFAGLSIFVASLMKTRERFMGIGQAMIMPLFFASNALYPIKLMPPLLQSIAIVNPLTYAVDAVRGLMISGDVTNITLDFSAVIIFDLIIFAVASISFKKIIE
ncbi:MAG: ABC-2 type transporter [Methanosaeta sp. PtaU1.Bin060]|nr:MAG: ABC-2 type transporter [Methanosaeta sp. PtaU1.Bin060]